MKKLFIAIAAIAIAISVADAEPATIRGILTVFKNQFVVNTSEPVEGKDETSDTEKVTRSARVQLVGYSLKDASWLKSLVGKKVTVEGDLETAHTRYHVVPLIIDFRDGDLIPETEINK